MMFVMFSLLRLSRFEVFSAGGFSDGNSSLEAIPHRRWEQQQAAYVCTLHIILWRNAAKTKNKKK